MREWLADRVEGELRVVESERAIDALFDLFSDRFVRYTLYFLSDRTTTSLDELAVVVTGLEATERGTISTPTDYEDVRIRLHHAVLPKLDAEGYVRFDHEEGTVTRTAPTTVAHAEVDVDR